jgi:hypothetical protein
MPAALPADWQLDDDEGACVGDAGGKHWGCRWGEVDGRQLPAETGVYPGDPIVIREEPKEGTGWHGSLQVLRADGGWLQHCSRTEQVSPTMRTTATVMRRIEMSQ